MSKAKTDRSNKQVLSTKLPQQMFSKFGKPNQFGMSKFQNRGQFVPPAIRITQNKGGGGK